MRHPTKAASKATRLGFGDLLSADPRTQQRLTVAASRAARERQGLRATEAAIAGHVVDLQQARERASLLMADAVPALTPRELEVLGLVASGRSDGEIAERLFISKKTASVHVANVKAKLGVASRVEMAMAATRAGLADEASRTPADARAAGQLKPSAVICPFKGLSKFEVTDAEFFFGREQLVAEMVARLVGATFLGVVGTSGSGKSSAIRAGLVPAIATGVLPGSERWLTAILRPGETPSHELGRVLTAALSGRLGDGAGSGPIEAAMDALSGAERLVLVVDQFEETFTACPDEEERVRFIETLLRAAGDPDSRAIVVLAVRADFYGRCAAYRGLADLLAANQVLVGAMSADEFRRAVELPARRAGLRVEPELAAAVVADVLDEPGGLPVLSTTLLELWQRRSGRTMRLETYRQIGGVSGSVERLAEAAYGRLTPPQQIVARAVMQRLAGSAAGDAIVRRRAPLSEFDADVKLDVARVLKVLTDSRLLTMSEGSVEVAHEALLREWPRLRLWLEEDAGTRRLREHLTRAAEEWEARGHDPAELYRGARLGSALDLTTEHGLELNDLERRFLAESRVASEREVDRQRRTNRRLRGLLAGTSAFLVLALVAGGLALAQRGAAERAAVEAERAAKVADAQRLGAQAVVENDLDRALLLARQAVAMDDSIVTRGNLLAALVRSPAALGIFRPVPGRLFPGGISADGQRVAVSGQHGDGAIVDAATGLVRERVFDITDDFGYSDDGRTLIISGDVGLLLRDESTGEVRDLGRLPDASAWELSPAADEIALLASGGRELNFRRTSDLGEIARIRSAEGTIFLTVPDLLFGVAYAANAPRFITLEESEGSARGSFDAPMRYAIVVRDLTSRLPIRTIQGEQPLQSFAISGDGRWFALGGGDGSVSLVDLDEGGFREIGRHDGAVWGAGFAPDGRTLVTTGEDRRLMVWDVAPGSLRETLAGHAGRVLGPVFSPDGATVFTTSRDGSLMSWDLRGTRRLGRLFTVGGPLGGAGIDDPTPQRLGWSQDGTRLAATQADGRVVVLDTRTFEVVRTITPFANGHVVSAGLDESGRRLVIGGDGNIGIWEVATGEPGPILEGGSAEIVRAVTFSPNGALVAGATDDGIIRLWDAYAGGSPTIVLRVTDSPVFRLVFSPDGGALLAAYGSGEATAWRVSDGSHLFTVPVSADDSALAAAYAPDGRTFVTGSAGGDLRFWDAATGEQRGSGAINPVGFVTSVSFSADGQTLATTWADGTTRLMDVATRTAIGPPIPGVANESELGIFLSDGRGVMVVSLTGAGFLWDVDPTHWEERACAIAGRQLTEEEWRRYLPNRPYRPACPEGGA